MRTDLQMGLDNISKGKLLSDDLCLNFSVTPLSRIKMRRHRVFLLCTVGLCVISFLHYYKALHYVSLLRELSAPYPNIKSFIMVTGFFWKEKGVAATPLSPASPDEAPPLQILHESDSKTRAMTDSVRGLEMRMKEEPEPPHPWEKPEENQKGDTLNEVSFIKRPEKV